MERSLGVGVDMVVVVVVVRVVGSGRKDYFHDTEYGVG